MTSTADESKMLVELAKEKGLKLMVGHLLEYHPGVNFLKEAIDKGKVGQPYYVYTQRVNLGIVRKDENAWWSLARRRNAAYYDKKFSGTVVRTPYISPDCVSIFNQYVIRVPRRDEVVAHLRDNNVGCEVYYPIPAHLQECFKYLGYKEGDLPESEKAANEVLAIPVYPELTDEMKDYVVDTIPAFFG